MISSKLFIELKTRWNFKYFFLKVKRVACTFWIQHVPKMDPKGDFKVSENCLIKAKINVQITFKLKASTATSDFYSGKKLEIIRGISNSTQKKLSRRSITWSHMMEISIRHILNRSRRQPLVSNCDTLRICWRFKFERDDLLVESA